MDDAIPHAVRISNARRSSITEGAIEGVLRASGGGGMFGGGGCHQGGGSVLVDTSVGTYMGAFGGGANPPRTDGGIWCPPVGLRVKWGSVV